MIDYHNPMKLSDLSSAKLSKEKLEEQVKIIRQFSWVESAEVVGPTIEIVTGHIRFYPDATYTTGSCDKNPSMAGKFDITLDPRNPLAAHDFNCVKIRNRYSTHSNAHAPGCNFYAAYPAQAYGTYTAHQDFPKGGVRICWGYDIYDLRVLNEFRVNGDLSAVLQRFYQFITKSRYQMSEQHVKEVAMMRRRQADKEKAKRLRTKKRDDLMNEIDNLLKV